jgi:hypothetical protein
MKTQDFNCSITANVTAEEAMEAISQVWIWWAKDFTGCAEKLNDQFTVRFGTTFVDFKITELIPGAKVVWTVTDCYLPFQHDKTEWTGTKAVFEIIAKNEGVTINFTHVGLVPEVECYESCTKGWTKYIPGSLQKLLTEGVGQPA